MQSKLKLNIILIAVLALPIILGGCGSPQHVSVPTEKARIAEERYGGVIATPEAYREVFGEPSVADAKYNGIIATQEQYDEAMRDNKK